MSAALQALHFLRPEWLWALALLPLLAWAWRRRAGSRDAWRGFVDPHLWAHLQAAPPRGRTRGGWAALLGAIAFVLAVLALAGPSWQRAPQPLWQTRSPLVVALDLSGSVAAADLPPSRLAQARAALQDLFDRREGGEVGMLVYAEDAFVVSPLTPDARNVALFLDALSPGIMPGDVDGPGRPAAAIAMAADLLRQAGHDRGDILLLEDAAGDAAVDAARAAAADGYRVSVLGLGTEAGAQWQDGSGQLRRAQLEPASLRALARAGGGRFVPLSREGALDALGVLSPASGDGGRGRGDAQLWQDQGYWLLLPLLLLVALAFRRGGAFGAIALCLLLPWQPARAADFADLWQRPDQQAHARMAEGAQAYARHDYAAALQAWQGLSGADAAYNRGNALAQLGQYPAAVAAYDRALALQPGMADARANRAIVRKAMQQSSAGDGEQHDRPARGDKSGEASQPPSSSPQPGDRQDAQAGADRAQRQRMQQALQQGQPRKPGQQGAPVPAQGKSETTREREQRLASEAWLRRVPDDPGGLLRARFELEYRRRRAEGQ